MRKLFKNKKTKLLINSLGILGVGAILTASVVSCTSSNVTNGSNSNSGSSSNSSNSNNTYWTQNWDYAKKQWDSVGALSINPATKYTFSQLMTILGSWTNLANLNISPVSNASLTAWGLTSSSNLYDRQISLYNLSSNPYSIGNFATYNSIQDLWKTYGLYTYSTTQIKYMEQLLADILGAVMNNINIPSLNISASYNNGTGLSNQGGGSTYTVFKNNFAFNVGTNIKMLIDYYAPWIPNADLTNYNSNYLRYYNNQGVNATIYTLTNTSTIINNSTNADANSAVNNVSGVFSPLSSANPNGNYSSLNNNDVNNFLYNTSTNFLMGEEINSSGGLINIALTHDMNPAWTSNGVLYYWMLEQLININGADSLQNIDLPTVSSSNYTINASNPESLLFNNFLNSSQLSFGGWKATEGYYNWTKNYGNIITLLNLDSSNNIGQMTLNIENNADSSNVGSVLSQIQYILNASGLSNQNAFSGSNAITYNSYNGSGIGFNNYDDILYNQLENREQISLPTTTAFATYSQYEDSIYNWYYFTPLDLANYGGNGGSYYAYGNPSFSNSYVYEENGLEEGNEIWFSPTSSMTSYTDYGNNGLSDTNMANSTWSTLGTNLSTDIQKMLASLYNSNNSTPIVIRVYNANAYNSSSYIPYTLTINKTELALSSSNSNLVPYYYMSVSEGNSTNISQ